MKNVITLLFSRDRAMQVDGVLRSFFMHCQDAECCQLAVIYKATNARYRQQYFQLIQEYQPHKVIWIEEKDFHRDVLTYLWKALDQKLTVWQQAGTILHRRVRIPNRIPFAFPFPNTNQYILFLVDDNLFVRDFTLDEIAQSLNNHPDALGYSLRLGSNTFYCYVRHVEQKLPEFMAISDQTLKYQWVGADLDFAYALEISSSIYRLADMVELISRQRFRNPNELEGAIAIRRPVYAQKQPALLCPSQSITFCNPINMVQNVVANPAGKTIHYSSDYLADLFDRGQRINVESYSGFIPNACHQEVELKFG